MDISSTLLAFGIVLASLTVHEAAHAWVADLRGDPTARMLGRVSLNPWVHIDIVGTIVLPLIAMFSGFPIIGWAKPVPVNINQLRHPKRDFMTVAAAGPASNLVMAFLAAMVFRAVTSSDETVPLGGLQMVLFMAVRINVLLAVFNMLPIPPLDGGNVLAGLLPDSMGGLIQGLRQYGFIILYALMFSGILWRIVDPPSTLLLRLLL
ncbi:MAG TPA: site-2 protease family protein [Vicinamibacterales bacterium]|nr:site-2 protease family protein [Vicinamibacterales bacterium]